jgi:hypothetical protein
LLLLSRVLLLIILLLRVGGSKSARDGCDIWSGGIKELLSYTHSSRANRNVALRLVHRVGLRLLSVLLDLRLLVIGLLRHVLVTWGDTVLLRVSLRLVLPLRILIACLLITRRLISLRLRITTRLDRLLIIISLLRLEARLLITTWLNRLLPLVGLLGLGSRLLISLLVAYLRFIPF